MTFFIPTVASEITIDNKTVFQLARQVGKTRTTGRFLSVLLIEGPPRPPRLSERTAFRLFYDV